MALGLVLACVTGEVRDMVLGWKTGTMELGATDSVICGLS